MGAGAFEMERVVVDYYSKLSTDPLLIQLVHGPTFVDLIGVYSSELFQKPGISE